MLDEIDTKKIDAVLRALATASRSLRLYPPTSPIPRQSVEAVMEALATVFADGRTSLSLAVARAGFQSGGESVGASIPGGPELADELRSHDVAGLEFAPAIGGDEVLTLLTILARPAEETRAEGGVGALCASLGVVNVRIAEVQLTVIDGQSFGGPENEVMRGMASDPASLGRWMGTVATTDVEALQD